MEGTRELKWQSIKREEKKIKLQEMRKKKEQERNRGTGIREEREASTRKKNK